MALWQVGFFVIPKESLDLGIPIKLSEEDSFDDSLFWEYLNLNPSFFDSIGAILPKKKSWSRNIILYGEENSNRFEVFFESEIIVSVSFRINFTSNYEDILRQLIEFFLYNNLIILDEKINIIPLNFEGVKGIIENSPQVIKYRTVSNG